MFLLSLKQDRSEQKLRTDGQGINAGIEDKDTLLLGLAQKGWIEFNERAGSFKCSPVVQEVTRKQNKERLAKDCAELIATLIDKLDYDGSVGHLINVTYEVAGLYSRYAENVVHSIEEPSKNLAGLCERIGSYHSTTGNLPKALSYFEEFTGLMKELYESYPENVGFKNGLAISYEKLGETQSALGNLQKALGYFEDETRLTTELYESYPENVGFKNGLAISYAKLGVFYNDERSDTVKAREYFQQAEAIWAELVKNYPAYAEFQRNWLWVKEVLDAL